MSLILDALRKSEHQRQRQAGPGLAVVPESQASRRPAAWIVVLTALLVVNIAVLAAVLLSGRGEPASSSATPATSVAPAPAPATAAAASRSAPTAVPLPTQPPRSEVRPLATEAPTQASRPAPAPAAAPAQAAAPTSRDGAPPRAEVEAPALPARAPGGTQAGEDARLPRFADMVIRGELNVPHMHIDIHVYSANPAERFVFINMRRYNEGQATQEGPRVERITRDGVVMDYQGQRFFLARD